MALADTARLIASLELQDRFSRPLSGANRSLSGFERNLGTATRATRGLGVAGVAVGTAIGNLSSRLISAGVHELATAAIDFESAFAGIKKTVDETDLRAAGLSFESLSESIRAMARTIPVAATELAAIGEAAGALGIRAEDIEAFTRTVAELSVTTDLTSDTAATALGQLGTILDLTGAEFRSFGDSLVALGNAGASTESQIIDISVRFAAAGRSAGLSTEDILGLSSAVASMGIDAEAGGSALSRIFNNVAVGIGTSSAKAEAFADALGLSAAEFRAAWERDAVGTFEDFLVQLEELDQFEAANLLKKIGINNVRDVNTVRLMSQNIEDVNAALEVSRSATGALGTEAAQRFATTASQIQILKNNLTDVAITIGSAVLPKITELSGKLVDALNTPGTQRAIEDFAAGIPAVIDDLVKIAQAVPWEAIGSSLQVAGFGARAILTAFTALPPWVQTAVITGWGLNKLTGGFLGDLASGLIKGILGINAGVVNINAAVVNGAGGVPTGPAKGAGGAGAAGALATILKNAIKVGVAAAILEEAGPGQVESDLRAEELAALLKQGGTLEQAQRTLNANLGVLQILAGDAELLRGLTDEQLEALNVKVAQLGPVPEALASLVDGVTVSNVSALAEAFGGKLATVKLKFDPSDLPRGTKEREGGAGRTDVPDTAIPGRAREGTHGAVLPDTALAPVTTGLDEVKAEVKTLAPIIERGSAATKAAITTGSAGIMNRVNQLKPKVDPSLLDRGTKAREGAAAVSHLASISQHTGETASAVKEQANRQKAKPLFVTDVKLDPSQVQDLRGQTTALEFRNMEPKFAADATRAAISTGSTGIMNRINEADRNATAQWARQHSQTLEINSVLKTAQQQAGADWDEQHRQTSAAHSLLSTTSAATKAAISTGSAGIINRVNQSIGVLGTTSAASKAAITSGSTGIMNRVSQEIAATTGVKGAVAQYGAAQLTKQAVVAAAVNNNTATLKGKNFAPKIKVTTNVTSNVSISEIQRKITSTNISTSVATGGGGFAV